MLGGVLRPEHGIIIGAGSTESFFSSPPDAPHHAIARVIQEVLAALNRSVVDNLWLGTDGVFVARGSQAERGRRAADILAALLVTPPPLDSLVGDLDLSDRQACAIARAMLREPALLVLDEATSDRQSVV